MTWRTVSINNPANLRLRHNKLYLTPDISIPLDEINSIILENPQVTVTGQLLSALSDYNITLFSCNAQYLPTGVFLPFQPHHRQLKILKAQLNVSKPFKKQCWAQIVRQKIKNQAICLSLLSKPAAEYLSKIATTVQSGDTTNRESYAAQIYFSDLLQSFGRRTDNTINAALNYGYSILRGVIARTLATYGFQPAVGIHHRNELNAFNLADDLIEPLRPLIDLWTAQNISLTDEQLTSYHKKEIKKLLYNMILINQRHVTILYAIEQMVQSFSTACLEETPKLLNLPILIPMQEHNNE